MCKANLFQLFVMSYLDKLIYWIGLGIIRLLQRLPLNLVARIGRACGLIAFYFDKRHRTVAINNLEMVFGEELDRKSIRKLAREHFQRLGENYASAICTLAMSPQQIDKIVDVRGVEKIRLSDPTLGRCRIMAIGHFGNFELYAKTSHHAPGFKFATTYRALKHRALDRLLRSVRSLSGCLYFERRTEVAQLHRTLSSHRTILGLLADQHSGKGSVIVPFFGRPAATTAAPALYALRYKTPVFPTICFRVALGRWRIEIGDPIPVFEDGRPRPVHEIMRDVNAAFEEAIRRDPANWFWVHRRWKVKSNAGHVTQLASVKVRP